MRSVREILRNGANSFGERKSRNPQQSSSIRSDTTQPSQSSQESDSRDTTVWHDSSSENNQKSIFTSAFAPSSATAHSALFSRGSRSAKAISYSKGLGENLTNANVAFVVFTRALDAASEEIKASLDKPIEMQNLISVRSAQRAVEVVRKGFAECPKRRRTRFALELALQTVRNWTGERSVDFPLALIFAETLDFSAPLLRYGNLCVFFGVVVEQQRKEVNGFGFSDDFIDMHLSPYVARSVRGHLLQLLFASCIEEINDRKDLKVIEEKSIFHSRAFELALPRALSMLNEPWAKFDRDAFITAKAILPL